MEYQGHFEHHVEMHKFHTGVVTGAVILALVLETFLLVHLRSADVIELPMTPEDAVKLIISAGVVQPEGQAALAAMAQAARLEKMQQESEPRAAE